MRLLVITVATLSLAPLPGTHFDVVLDRTDWLTFGYAEGGGGRSTDWF